MAALSRDEGLSDYSPLSQACVKALTDREDKRQLAASEIERMTAEFSVSNNFTMINRLILVLKDKFCLTGNSSTRKGGLIGMAAVMVGFKNGSSTDPPSEMVEEVVRPVLTCIEDSDWQVRFYACQSLYNIIKVARSTILPLFQDIFHQMSKIVEDPQIGVRNNAEHIDRLLKDIIIEHEPTEIQAVIPKFENYIYTNKPFTKMFVISWIQNLNLKVDMIQHLPTLLDILCGWLGDTSEEIRASGHSLLVDIVDKVDISRFTQTLCKTFRDKQMMMEERGNFIVLNLCSTVRPEIIYRSFAEILKEYKTVDPKFVYNMVQKLNEILLTTQPLSALRSRLSKEADPEMVSLFCTLYSVWCCSPIAALTLCLLTSHYQLASEIVSSLPQKEIDIELLTQIDWVIQLIESPIFASLRMRLLDVGKNQLLLRSLYGLLMILPQSEAYKKLSHRLDQVHKFTTLQTAQPVSVAPASNTKTVVPFRN